MALPDIQLDDRRFEEIVAEARRRIPGYTPEWTDLNEQYPGGRAIFVFFVRRIAGDLENYADAGVAMGMYNLDKSIRDFARASMNYGLNRKYPVYMSPRTRS